jgi:hypothetical protein
MKLTNLRKRLIKKREDTSCNIKNEIEDSTTKSVDFKRLVRKYKGQLHAC